MQASSFGNYIDEEAFKNSFVQQSLSELFIVFTKVISHIIWIYGLPDVYDLKY